ncbi:class I SAM-dependent methyltransferase [Leptolyngbya iicbica]|uniref:Class I SAM-dependent methyltransferase n=2 Tax=Cyanophyceae TaxID=3028117 RepID=A0A4Q7E9S4_9CYAN|nr:class I SAM-dependent methyltransferase [Leptolyngbya sp. LK]RZM79263.1 class I SAM-dependent methyltransferase [Leptolyngbya sp. LK]
MPVSLGKPELCAVIRDRIQRSPQQQIPFADFMALALYQPDYGYYTSQAEPLGMEGDFATSVHLGPDFGELLAEQLVEMWHHLGRPHPFHLVEMGPGQGLLADTILAYLQRQYWDCFAAVHYTLVETSAALRQVQQTRLVRWQAASVPIDWRELADLPAESVTGCCFSNELVDALPVHRVTLTADGWQEQYVTHREGAKPPFSLVLGPLSQPALSSYFDWVGVVPSQPTYPDGYTTEVNLAALDWLKEVATKLHRGYVLTIDYGYTAERYYSPARSQGTLQCYYQHAHHNDPLINIGQQDITAHVDFTALELQGDRVGLSNLGQVPQELFLMALGLGDRLNQLMQMEASDPQAVRYALQRREALHQLMNPLGVGKFNVLIQGKGLETLEQKTLKGLTLPPLM